MSPSSSPDFAEDIAKAIDAYNQGRPQDAEAICRALPERAPVLQLLGLTLTAQGRLEEAAQALEKARALSPADAALRLDLAAALAGLGRADEAAAELEEAHRLAPAEAVILSNLGSLHQSRGHWREAIDCYRRAIALDADDAIAHGNLGACLLGLGHWAEGFAEYEGRLGQSQIRRSPSPLPVWRGEPLAGKSLLVTAEQGYGDMIQFARFLPALAAQEPRRLILECRPGLERLLAPLVTDTVTMGKPLPQADYQVPLLSLGQRLGWEAAAKVPYLPCPPAQPSGRVGLVWTGRPVEGTAFQRHLHGLRHFDATLLEPLTRIPGIHLVSLQQAWTKGRTGDLPIEDISSRLNDFQDTAEIVSGLDLVITIDSAVAHLAGAMGKPVWVLLGPGQHDYRWQTSWYPQARLFRCGEDGWPGCLAEVARALCFRRALDCHQAGDEAAAAALYAHLLSLQPDHPQGLCNLGQIEAGRQRPDLAEALYRDAIAARPDFPEAWNNLGALLKDQQRLDEAAQAFRRAVEARADFALAWNSLGNVLKLQGDFAVAADAYDRALALDPALADALINRAGCRLVSGQLEEAVADTIAALSLRPHFPEAEGTLRLVLMELGVGLLERMMLEPAEQICRLAVARYADDAECLFRLGNVLLKSRRLDEAAKTFQQAIEIDPDFGPAYNNLCSIHLERDEIAKALSYARSAAALAADLPDVWNNLGNALRANAKPEEALGAYGQALALRPAFPEAFNNLGVLMGEMGLVDGALAAFQQATVLRPDYAEAYSNMGNVLKSRRRNDEAIAAYHQALAVRPDYHGARLNLAIGLLQMGRWREGWEHYHARWLTGPLARHRVAFLQPEWDGGPLEGKTILFYGEQGYGDVLQFVRYAPLLAARGGRVVVLCQKGLVRLFQGIAGVAEVRPFDDPPAQFDTHLAMMSAPKIFDTRPETIPPFAPYLSAEPQAAEDWRRRLAHLPGRKVGLVWSGDPRPHDLAAHMLDKQRSLSLQAFAFMKEIQGLSFVSLQKGAPSVQVKDSPFPLFDATDEIRDFADTAALVEALDLVVSVDTSTVHLAGGMGKPVWILSRYDGCWRWLLDREETDWYPSARLFLQTAPNDWSAALVKLEARLREFAAQS